MLLKLNHFDIESVRVMESRLGYGARVCSSTALQYTALKYGARVYGTRVYGARVYGTRVVGATLWAANLLVYCTTEDLWASDLYTRRLSRVNECRP